MSVSFIVVVCSVPGTFGLVPIAIGIDTKHPAVLRDLITHKLSYEAIKPPNKKFAFIFLLCVRAALSMKMCRLKSARKFFS